MKTLADGASFHSMEKKAPSKAEIKQLAQAEGQLPVAEDHRMRPIYDSVEVIGRDRPPPLDGPSPRNGHSSDCRLQQP
jgi:hypothetical protein